MRKIVMIVILVASMVQGVFAQQIIIEEFYKLKYCSTVVYMVPRA